jgi:hypothetical protein
MADYHGDALEFAQAQCAVERAQLFVQGLLALKTDNQLQQAKVVTFNSR